MGQPDTRYLVKKLAGVDLIIRQRFVVGSYRVLAVLMFLSLAIHFTGLWLLSIKAVPPAKKVTAVKVRIVSQPSPKKLVETKLAKTEAPKKAKYQGAQDHKTSQETKVKKIAQDKGLDPGAGGRGKVNRRVRKKAVPKTKLGPGNRKPRNAYEALLPVTQDLPGMTKAGYQDYITDDIPEGDKVDLNTTDYRYIGYFTSFRKQFELVWVYPREAARRGLKGTVYVEFTIGKDGKLKKTKVRETSGFEILDQAVIQALKLAGPYNPLPEGFGKEQLVVKGSFIYNLN